VPFLLEHFQDVPGDRLAFPIRVGGEDQFVRTLQGVGDVLDALLGTGVDFPFHGEVGIRLHGTVFGWQIADMAKAGQHLVAGAKVLVDGFGLGWGLDDKNVHWGTGYSLRVGATL
jgi:hypothetical protein